MLIVIPELHLFTASVYRTFRIILRICHEAYKCGRQAQLLHFNCIMMMRELIINNVVLVRYRSQSILTIILSKQYQNELATEVNGL